MDKTGKKLRIAQVGSIWETTPPKLYGGTERVIHDLTEELVKKGHKVTLYATGDSITSAKLKFIYPKAAYRNNVPWTNFLYPFDHVSQAFLHAEEFDIIHVHLNKVQDYAALALARLVSTPTVFTIHFQIPTPNQKEKLDRLEYLKKYRDNNFISISDAQRTLDLNYIGTVHNGLNFDQFIPGDKPGEDLVWLGSFTHEKGTAEAIAVAKKTGINILLAGKIDVFEKKMAEYFEKKVEPYIDGDLVKYIGEVNDRQKIQLLKKARVLLNPINWNEPFGLTTIEAMAMGVPVIAFNKGPMKEIIRDGETGFLVANVRQMIKAVKRVGELNRNLIRQYALSHFSSKVMAGNYEKIYFDVVKRKKRDGLKKQK